MKLRISPLVRLRLEWLCQRTPNEVSCIGLSDKTDLLCLTDIVMVRQKVSTVSIEMDTENLADIVDEYASKGIEPWRLSTWIHTHPSGCNNPSGVDEKTMETAFGNYPSAIMLILTKAGVWYARLDINEIYGKKKRVSIPLEVEIDYSLLKQININTSDWEKEFNELVSTHSTFSVSSILKEEKIPESEWGESEWDEPDWDESEYDLEQYEADCWKYGLEPREPDSWKHLYGEEPPAIIFGRKDYGFQIY